MFVNLYDQKKIIDEEKAFKEEFRVMVLGVINRHQITLDKLALVDDPEHFEPDYGSDA
jgi:hypothetical protein